MGSLRDSTLVTKILRTVFTDLSEDVIDELGKHATTIDLCAGQTLCTAGQPYDNMIYILDQGTLEVHHAGNTSEPLEYGHFIGFDNYFDNLPYAATAKAKSAVKLIALPTDIIRRLEQQCPEFSDSIHHLWTERLRRQTSQRQVATGVWALPARAIMQSPLAICRTNITVRAAFKLMKQRRIGSLGVVDENNRLLGILTFAVLAEALIEKGIEPDTALLGAMSAAPCLIESDTPLWKIQSEQSRLRIKYLVVQEHDTPIGVVSQTDILQTLLSYQRSVIAQIADTADFAGLKNLTDGLGQIARELREHHHSASQTARALSEVHLAIQRRCIELVLKEMNVQGKGEAPLAYALIIMGSGGRKEMLLGADQDNGIILAESPDEIAQAWFVDFCDRVNRRLDEIGYAWCTGNIMARNPDFHKSLPQWKEYITRITEIPTEKTARWSAIFFDFELLYGSDRLTKALRDHLHQQLQEKPRLLTLMVEDDASGGPALGLFNRLITASDKQRKGKIDLKRNGSRLLADAARIYALSESIDVNNTGDRLRALARLGRLDSTFVQSVLAAYDEILDLTLAHQLRQLKSGTVPDKLVTPNELTPLDKQSLRIAMQIIKRLQGRLQGEFGTITL